MSTVNRRNKSRSSSTPANPVQRWIEMFLDYCRSECHLSSNTVAAYRRDMAKFAVWLDKRRFQDLTINELADYPAFLNLATGPCQYRPAHCCPKGFLSLSAV